MSSVTNMTLFVEFDDDLIHTRGGPIGELNQYLAEREHCSSGFAPLFEAYGGNKCCESYVYGASVNYLGIDDFLKYAQGLKWASRKHVLFVINDEHEDGYTAWRLDDPIPDHYTDELG